MTMTTTTTDRRAPCTDRAARPHQHTTDQMVDDAAGLLAWHGLAGGTVGVSAFAVVFARTGLRQHFPTRQALLDAAVEVSRRHVAQILARVVEVPRGRGRDLAVVEWAVDFALAWPGVAALGRGIAEARVVDVELERQGLAVLTVLGVDEGEDERAVNVALAFTGLAAATNGLGGEHPPTGRDLIVAATMRTLGHAPSCTPAGRCPAGTWCSSTGDTGA